MTIDMNQLAREALDRVASGQNVLDAISGGDPLELHNRRILKQAMSVTRDRITGVCKWPALITPGMRLQAKALPTAELDELFEESGPPGPPPASCFASMLGPEDAAAIAELFAVERLAVKRSCFVAYGRRAQALSEKILLERLDKAMARAALIRIPIARVINYGRNLKSPQRA